MLIACDDIEVAYYEEIKSLPDHPEKLLIDVRTPVEIKNTGKIPTSINIPFDDFLVEKILEEELSLSASDFYKHYHRIKPNFDDPIIFTCRVGTRSKRAAETAYKMGYRNVKYYEGSWEEWCVMENLCTNDAASFRDLKKVFKYLLVLKIIHSIVSKI